MSGLSDAGRPSNAFRNFIGLGVWVSAARVMQGRQQKSVAIPTLSKT